MSLPFTKMHGAGNDFIVLDGLREKRLPELDALAARLCDRHLGIGADQILVARPSKVGDFRMDIWNADGSRAEMCANGIRCFAKFLRDRGYSSAGEIAVETLAGVVRPRFLEGDRIRIEMGRPVLAASKIPTKLAGGDGPILDAALEVEGETLAVSSVSMGNPHAVVFVDDPEAAPVERLGPLLEHHPAFPNRVNVEFAAVAARDRIRQRTWERGSGETLACGSGACAVGVVAMLKGQVEPRVAIELRGGTLEVEWAGGDAPVFLTGPAVEVFTGSFPLEEG